MGEFVSIKDIIKSPAMQERIKAKRARRDKIRAEYNEGLWDEIKKKMRDASFPEDPSKFRKLMGNSMHRVDGKSHTTEDYIYEEYLYDELFSIEFRYSYCPECKKVTKRKKVALNRIANKADVVDLIDTPNYSHLDLDKLL